MAKAYRIGSSAVLYEVLRTVLQPPVFCLESDITVSIMSIITKYEYQQSSDTHEHILLFVPLKVLSAAVSLDQLPLNCHKLWN